MTDPEGPPAGAGVRSWRSLKPPSAARMPPYSKRRPYTKGGTNGPARSARSRLWRSVSAMLLDISVPLRLMSAEQ
jgi:hypothetical protein